jgi:hypothetical protein
LKINEVNQLEACVFTKYQKKLCFILRIVPDVWLGGWMKKQLLNSIKKLFDKIKILSFLFIFILLNFFLCPTQKLPHSILFSCLI